jgi:hypothetical protein
MFYCLHFFLLKMLNCIWKWNVFCVGLCWNCTVFSSCSKVTQWGTSNRYPFSSVYVEACVVHLVHWVALHPSIAEWEMKKCPLDPVRLAQFCREHRPRPLGEGARRRGGYDFLLPVAVGRSISTTFRHSIKKLITREKTEFHQRFLDGSIQFFHAHLAV